jgi:hypothetical protein
MRDKLAITQALIAQLKPDDRLDVNTAMRDWWQNIRSGSGLRLTVDGYATMKQLGVASYHFDIRPDQLTPRLLVQLDQRLHDPYFLKADRRRPWIEFYGSREALLANLYGDLSRFLENYS